MKRYCESFIYQDLKKKMVFLGGPRQVGKTTLAKTLCTEFFNDGEYLNWDVDDERRAIMAKHWRLDSPLIIFDELHKYPKWKQWIKGVYDSKPQAQQYMVTGSARLDVYRQGGDSLLGRYHYWRLHPLTIDECPQSISPSEALERLMTLGGFPEPFLQDDLREANRWRRERFDRILKEDIRDLEPIRHIQLLYLYVDALRDRVGSTIEFANIARDLQISPKTAKEWLGLIERMYIAFAVYPLTRNIPRSIQKPVKVYFFDNADVINNSGARFENLIATTLLKRLHFLEDYYGNRCSLHYIRDKDGREVDFATVVDNQIIDLIEVKTKSTDIGSSLKYYSEKLNPKNTVQIVHDLKKPFDAGNIRVTNPLSFFKVPPWQLKA